MEQAEFVKLSQDLLVGLELFYSAAQQTIRVLRQYGEFASLIPLTYEQQAALTRQTTIENSVLERYHAIQAEFFDAVGAK